MHHTLGEWTARCEVRWGAPSLLSAVASDFTDLIGTRWATQGFTRELRGTAHCFMIIYISLKAGSVSNSDRTV